MSTAGYSIAEAYVLRKIHADKLKKMDEERGRSKKITPIKDNVKNHSTGCFMFKFSKIHPTKVVGTT